MLLGLFIFLNYDRQPPKTPDSALRSLDKMLIYLRVNSAFVSVVSLDSEVFGACRYFPVVPSPLLQGGLDFINILRSFCHDLQRVIQIVRAARGVLLKDEQICPDCTQLCFKVGVKQVGISFRRG